MTTKISFNDLAPGAFTTLCKVKPMGALQARKQTTGAVSFYWRYSIGAKSERVPIGLYDSSAPPKSLEPTDRGHSFAAAVRAAETMALQHHQHRDEGGRPALLAAQREARRAVAESKKLAEEFTLTRLLDDYCNYLQALGRRSHADARSIFKVHIKEAWPKIAAMPAKDVTSEQVADMMRRCIEAGKGRTANKLRSYARAAYQTAKAAKSKPSIPVAFKSFGIALNPVADTAPDESANNADKNPMTAAELRAYWQAIHDLPGFKGAVLRLHLLTGGQRIEQLVNLRTADISAESILLFDGKGRPGKAPRPHTVPLTREAARALKDCEPAGVYALSTDGGGTHLAATSLSAWAIGAAGTAIPDFQAKRIRSGVETLLAAAGVSQEIRGRLQSHGISGVQARHYDGHDYLTEKLEALRKLYRLLQPVKGGKVVAFRRA
jgi:integrase